MLSNLKAYFRPKSIPEALALLEKNSGSILVVAGGTKLLQIQNNIVQELVDITALGLNYIRESSSEIRLGATTPLQYLVDSATAGGMLAEAARLSDRSTMIRNVSTVGGQLISTTPLSPLYCAFLALQAQVRIAGGSEFALAMNIFLNKKGLEGGLLVEVIVPKTKPTTFSAIAPIQSNGQHPLICACTRITFMNSTCSEAKLAITGTQKVPQRLHAVETFLEGKELNEANVAAAADIACEMYHPISDAMASEEYRNEVARVVVKRTLRDCLEQFEDNLESQT